MERNVTRKDFLVKTSKAALGVTAVASISSLITAASTKAGTKITSWPWPYQPVNLESIRIRAHHLKLSGYECCSGLFGAFVEAQSQMIGAPWTHIPYEAMLFGRGGGAGWGTLCGAVNAAAAIISLVVDRANSGPLIWEVYGWAASTELPTDEANQFALNSRYTVTTFNGVAQPQSLAGSVLCHASLTKWCVKANKHFNSPERKERCGRITGDVAVKTGEVLNSFFAGSFVSQYVTPAYAKQCLTCHGANMLGNVRYQENCEPCHGNPHSGTNVEEIGGPVSSFQLSQNFPNPFNPSTKIRFSLPQTEKVRLEIYDIQGNLIRSLVDYELYNAGNYETEWNGTDNFGNKVTSGIYFVQMQAGKFIETKKMNLVK